MSGRKSRIWTCSTPPAENELIPDLNDEGTAPEEMKFFPANPVSKLDVLNAWQKAQELKNN